MTKMILPADMMRASVEFWCRIATAQVIFASHMMSVGAEKRAAPKPHPKAAIRVPQRLPASAAASKPMAAPEGVVSMAKYRNAPQARAPEHRR